ncbi:hypothetical protein A0H81_14534 [Grifola frondosa]|uniref:Uncharacterized protein n=1 Tax=Grifola frondosa TaxID=5627 RepID=A0A1C7LMN2_GRIFR|nr:hypothetical protein A0H81_14534 [Grifola frondosa]
MPDIETFYLSLNPERCFDSPGFDGPLRLINPSHLLVDFLSDNALAVDLVKDVLAPSIESWTALKRVDLSDPDHYGAIWSAQFRMALREAPHLKYIFIGKASARYEAAKLDDIARNPQIREIYCRGTVDWRIWNNASEDLRKVLRFGSGINSVSLQEIAICDENLMPGQRVQTTRRNIIISSKRFNRLGIIFLYSVPFISTYINAQLFAAHINSHPNHARLDLNLLTESRACNTRVLLLPAVLSAVSPQSPSPILSLSQVISNRSDLEGFDIGITPSAFACFPHLRCLTLRGGHVAFDPDDIPRDALPSLNNLDISQCGPTLILLLAEMRLPSLKKSAVGMKHGEEAGCFLSKHGAALTSLSVSDHSLSWPRWERILDLCPNVIELLLADAGPPKPVSLTSPGKTYPKLTRILLPNTGPHITNPAITQRWTEFLEGIDFEPLLSLVEFRLESKNLWPLSEAHALLLPWAHLARELRKLGIALADMDGNRWERTTKAYRRLLA